MSSESPGVLEDMIPPQAPKGAPGERAGVGSCFLGWGLVGAPIKGILQQLKQPVCTHRHTHSHDAEGSNTPRPPVKTVRWQGKPSITQPIYIPTTTGHTALSHFKNAHKQKDPE